MTMKRRKQTQRKVQVEAMVERANRSRNTGPKKARHHVKKSSKTWLRAETLREGEIRASAFTSPAKKVQRS